MTSQSFSAQLPKALKYSLIFLTAAVWIKLFNRTDADYDLWLHVFIGIQIISNGVIPPMNTYSFTAPSYHFIDHEWLSQVILGALWMNWGELAIFIWRWAIISLSTIFILLTLKARNPNFLVKLIAFYIFSIIASPGAAYRLHLYSLLFLSILIFILERARSKDNPLPIFLPIILFALWANLHAAFPLGLGVYGAYALSSLWEKRDLSILFRATLGIFTVFLATFINPYGHNLIYYTLLEVSNPIGAAHNSDWQKFAFETRELPFLFFVGISWLITLITFRSVRLDNLLCLAAGTGLGILAVRNTIFFGILALPTIVTHISSIFDNLQRKGSSEQKHLDSPLSLTIASGAICIFALFFIWQAVPKRFGITIGSDPLPVNEVEHLKAINFKGNLWTPLHWGAYSLFHLYPNVKVSLDGRWTTAYPLKVMEDNMKFAYRGDKNVWENILDQYSADAALVEYDNPVIQEMKHSMTWRFVLLGEAGGLLIRNSLLDQTKSIIIKGDTPPKTWP